MKKLILSALAAGMFATGAFSADLIVDVTGVGGSYSTLTSAIAASAAGDRLLIYPNGTPFSENITIPHSLQLVSATEGERWNMNGSITIATSLGAGGEVTIASVDMISGSISSASNIAGGPAEVRIVNSKLSSGIVNFNHNNFHLIMAQDSLMNGYVQMRKGSVTGCYITPTTQNAGCIYTYTSTTVDTEYLYIVGNKLVGTTYTNFSQNPAPINWNCTSSLAYIANNYIVTPTTNQNPIYIVNTSTASGVKNYVINNTANYTGSSNTYMIYLATISSQTDVFNNLSVGGGSYGIYSASANNLNITTSYNHMIAPSGTLINILDDGTNVFNVAHTIDTNTGELLTGPGVDGGHPDAAYTDLDLSRNDVGCFGGSYSRANFIGAATGARTTFMVAPRRVLVGQTIDIQGQGFDY